MHDTQWLIASGKLEMGDVHQLNASIELVLQRMQNLKPRKSKS